VDILETCQEITDRLAADGRKEVLINLILELNPSMYKGLDYISASVDCIPRSHEICSSGQNLNKVLESLLQSTCNVIKNKKTPAKEIVVDGHTYTLSQ
jgi:hypothetical protein